MNELTAALEATALAQALKQSQWLYPFVNAGHILGVSLLIGAVVPLDLTLARILKRTGETFAMALLRPFAIAGLLLAIVCGLLLFITQATDYVRNPMFIAKMSVFGIAAINAVLHSRIDRVSARAGRALALLSLVLWPSVLILGRLIGYTVVAPNS